MSMFRPINLNLEDVVKLVGNVRSEEFFYEEDAQMTVTRERLLECDLSDSDKDVLNNIPPNTILRVKNIDMGTFAIQLS